MSCKSCGGAMIGDGYKTVLHCESVDLWAGESATAEPDAAPIYCEPLQRDELEECPDCKQKSVYAKPRGGVACNTPGCGYWFCF